MSIDRCERIIEKMKEENIRQLIVTSSADLFYILGKCIDSGERMQALYINDKGEKKFIINEIVTNLSDIKGVEVYSYTDDMDPMDILLSIVDKEETLAIDKFWQAHFLIELLEMIPKLKVVKSTAVDLVRMIKDEDEKKLLRNAANIVDKAIMDLIEVIKSNPKIKESEAAAELKKIFASYGTYEYSFEPIIAYGPNGADPHHSTDNTSTLKLGDSIVIDIGGKTDFYCSDTTRTVFYGKPCEEAEKIYNVVLQANLKAIEAIKPGVAFCDIDRVARKVIEDAGYGQYFTHRTGHSIGIEDHENPSVSSKDKTIVESGMAFSIEPGIYIPGKYGARIEDIVIACEDGCEILNKTSKDLIVF